MIISITKFPKTKKLSESEVLFCVLTYTKRNVNAITFLCTLLLFFCFHFALNYFISDISLLQNQKLNASCKEENRMVYSKVIPLNEIAKQKQASTKLVDLHDFHSLTNSLIEVENNDKLKKQEILSTSLDDATVKKEESENTKKEQEIEEKEPTTARVAIKTYEKSDWRIQIPRLNLDVHILEGTDSNVLLKAVGHFENMAKWNGNVGLAAHNRGYHCNFFKNIKNLKQGDEIIYSTNQGKRVYKVIVNQVIEETDWSYLKETVDNRITLITCEENRRAYRRCIQAVEVRLDI